MAEVLISPQYVSDAANRLPLSIDMHSEIDRVDIDLALCGPLLRALDHEVVRVKGQGSSVWLIRYGFRPLRA